MEETLIGKPVADAPSNGEIVNGEDTAKRQRSDRCFSFMEISIEPGIKSLKHLDSKKFKSEIKRWAKAVVVYARQVSGRFGSSRRSSTSRSSTRLSESPLNTASGDDLKDIQSIAVGGGSIRDDKGL